ncbi:hypothetical protein [Achromobacter sp. NFACC18-2]|uniref:hypothetical protein n=1 Tax=Achromobacter sp. NFACC18-2 TaxID=1564112 RepID=UPI0008D7AB41|nr:hypothetical protein [Achromobacter sp. NFACC18-2]SEJ85542.1 hypothetical protein SAMN03159494_03606 [Achromobacter sp. NFACC18-2]
MTQDTPEIAKLRKALEAAKAKNEALRRERDDAIEGRDFARRCANDWKQQAAQERRESSSAKALLRKALDGRKEAEDALDNAETVLDLMRRNVQDWKNLYDSMWAERNRLYLLVRRAA